MNISKNKNLKIFLGVLLIAAFVLSSTGEVLAQPRPTATPTTPATPTAPAAQSLTSKGLGLLTDIGKNALIIYAVIFFVQSFASALLTMAGFIMDKLFVLNVILVPNTITVVLDGWTIMRDIANSLFILIVLWIALTIIFNFEEMGGRKLLVRVIVIALLINFSLVMVSTVFGFANLLAKPFQTAISGDGKVGLSDIIMSKTKVYNAVAMVQDSDIAKLKEEQQKTSLFERAGNTIAENTTAKSVLTVCGLGSLVLSGFTPAALGLGTACVIWAPTISSWASGFLSGDSGLGLLSPMKTAASMAIGTIFILLTAFAFLTAAIVLLWRMVAMVLIAVLAPGAFLLHAIPGK